jgi:hypothetical protein
VAEAHGGAGGALAPGVVAVPYVELGFENFGGILHRQGEAVRPAVDSGEVVGYARAVGGVGGGGAVGDAEEEPGRAVGGAEEEDELRV